MHAVGLKSWPDFGNVHVKILATFDVKIWPCVLEVR